MTLEYTLMNRHPSQGPSIATGEGISQRPARIACLVALAHRFDGLIRSGAVRDQSELALLCHVTRARVTQIINLLNLTPEIQEYLLWLPADQERRITERQMRQITAEVKWDRQRGLFRRLAPPR